MRRARMLRVAIGGAIPGFVSYEALLRDRDGSDISDPQLGNSMLYTSGTTGKPKGVYRSSAPPTSPSLVGSADYRPGSSIHLVTGPLYHAAPLSLAMGIPQLFGAAVVLMDGWDNRARAGADRASSRHAHAPGADDDASAAVAARGRAQAARPVVAEVRPARRGAVPADREARDDRLARADRLGVLRRDRRHRHARRLRRRGSRGPAPSAGPTRPITSASSTKPAGRCRRCEAGLIYMKAPASGRFNYYKDDWQDRPRVSRRLLHARRRRLSRRGRLPVPDRPQRAPDHLGRRQHLSGGGRGRAVRASGSRGRRRDRRAGLRSGARQ